ncbi:MAG: NAD(+) diphosphatase [Nocardioidaceae bacterium]
MSVPEFPPPGSVDIALSRRTHDRVGQRRTDETWLADAWADCATSVLPMGGSRFPVTGDGTALAWRVPADLEGSGGTRMFLGMRDGVAHFALQLGREAAGDDWASLRDALQRLAPQDAGLAVHAVGLAEWLLAHRYCPRCGGRLETGQAGHVLTCDSCGRQQFPRTDPAVIMLVTDGERALLGRQSVWPAGRYSTLAGFVEPGESLEDAVRREVAEEVGVTVGEVRYFGNQPWPMPASLMVGFFAHAETIEICDDEDEIAAARWFTREQVREEAEAGALELPGGISISRSLVEAWYGGPLPGEWGAPHRR